MSEPLMAIHARSLTASVGVSRIDSVRFTGDTLEFRLAAHIVADIQLNPDGSGSVVFSPIGKSKLGEP